MDTILHILIIGLLLYVIVRMEKKSTSGCPCAYYRDIPAIENRSRKTGRDDHQAPDIGLHPMPRSIGNYYATYRNFPQPIDYDNHEHYKDIDCHANPREIYVDYEEPITPYNPMQYYRPSIFKR